MSRSAEGDTLNNLHRYCALPGDTKSRQWQVIAVRDGRHMVRHRVTGECRPVWVSEMRGLH